MAYEEEIVRSAIGDEMSDLQNFVVDIRVSLGSVNNRFDLDMLIFDLYRDSTREDYGEEFRRVALDSWRVLVGIYDQAVLAADESPDFSIGFINLLKQRLAEVVIDIGNDSVLEMLVDDLDQALGLSNPEEAFLRVREIVEGDIQYENFIGNLDLISKGVYQGGITKYYGF